MFGMLELRARMAARRAAYGLVGICLIFAGLIFWTLAGWIYLTLLYGALYAAVILAAIYTGLGLIFLGLAGRRRIRVPLSPLAPAPVAAAPIVTTSPLVPLAQALALGIQAGINARKPKKD